MYQIIIVWDDCSSKTKAVDQLTSALTRACVYLEDPHCIRIVIYDWNKKQNIMNWSR